LQSAAPSDSDSNGTRVEGNGSHPYRFELVIATEQDFKQDRGKNTFSIDGIPWEFPLFHLRYSKKPPSVAYLRLNPNDISGASPPGSCEPSGPHHDTPVKHHSGPASRDDTAVRDENAIMTTGLSRFDPRFIDLIPPENTRFEQSLQDTAKWLQSKPPALQAFLAMHQKKHFPAAAHSLAGVDSPKRSPHEDKVSAACANLLQAISEKILDCLGSRTAATSCWIACGTSELLPAKSTPARRFGKEPSSKPGQVLKLPPARDGAANLSADDSSTGTKRKRKGKLNFSPTSRHLLTLALL
jgi:hypothetical protein